MNTLVIILQFGVSMKEPLSGIQQFIFWGFLVLFAALFIVFLYRTNKIISAKKQSLAVVSPVKTMKKDESKIADEEAAAIALAISMYKIEMHDMESLTITLKKVSRIYSPWSSKIYTLTQNPR